MAPFIEINGRRIGPGYPTYIIAEMSANHGQDFDRAVKIVEAAKKTGADAVKLQTFTPDTITINCSNQQFKIKGTLWEGRTLYDLYRQAYMPWEWQPDLMSVAAELGLDFFSTPSDNSSIDFLESIDLPAYKIASFEAIDLPLLRRVAQTGKPVIISTGISTLSEIDEAVQTMYVEGATQLALLKCTSAYPAPPEAINLRTIPHLAETFNLPIGLSDHTTGIAVPVAAVALGACIIEKHLTITREMPSLDREFSLEPGEFKEMVQAVRVAEKSLGKISYSVTSSEKDSSVHRRSLFVVEDMRPGECFSSKNVRSIRPGYGLHPRYLADVLGKYAVGEIKRGTPLSWSLITPQLIEGK